jgi:protein-L-isoaspartate(D-aspartate) O-methyltransferase
MNYQKAKLNMIEQQIRPWNVLDERVLASLEALPREDFVAPEQAGLAYADVELPLFGGSAKLLTPKIQAKLVQDLQVKAGEKVLELGAMTGYVTALLCSLGAKVKAYEANETFLESAKSNVARLHEKGLIPTQADFVLGTLPRLESVSERFDAILVGGSVAKVPESLLSLLNPRGRLIAIVGDAPIMTATLFTSMTEGKFEKITLWETMASRLAGVEEDSAFVF